MTTVNQQNVAQLDHANNDVIDLRFLVGFTKVHKWFVLFVVLLALFIGGFYAWSVPTIYKSSASINVKGDSTSTAYLSAILGVTNSTNAVRLTASAADTETSIIESGYVLGEVAERLKLNVAAIPRRFPLLGKLSSNRSSGLLPSMLPSFVWGQSALEVEKLVVPSFLEGAKFQLIVGEKQGSYQINSPEGSAILSGVVGEEAVSNNAQFPIKVLIKNLQANPGAEFILIKKPLNAAVENLLAGLKINEDGQKTGILNLTYESRSAESAQKILNTILDVAVEKNISEKSEEVSKSLDFLQQQLPNVLKDLDASEKNLNNYNSQSGTANNAVEIQILMGEIVEMEKELNALSLKKLEMLESFTPKHPYILAIDEKQAQLENQLKKDKEKLRKFPVTSQQMMSIERDIKVHGDIYSAVMQNMQQMQMLKGSIISSVRILEKASYPVTPIPRKTAIILLISAVAGLFFAVFFLLLRYMLSNNLDPVTIERVLGVQVLSVIPYSKEQETLSKEMLSKKIQKENFLLSQAKPKDTSVEALRGLRTSLKLVSLSEGKNVIAVSGCSPHAGKSFVSSNLALLLSGLGEKVLLIDADMRKGHLHKMFVKPSSPGLAEFLKGEVSLENAIQKFSPHVDFLSAGAYPSNPAELLMHQRFDLLIKEVKAKYDIVLIDTPPILAVTDASLIFKSAEIKLLVVGSGKDHMHEIEHTKGIFEKSGIALDGIVYNTLQQGRKKFGYGGYYNYYNYNYKYE